MGKVSVQGNVPVRLVMPKFGSRAPKPVDPTPIVASSAALAQTFSMQYQYEQAMRRANARAESLGVPFMPEFNVDDMIREEMELDAGFVDDAEERLQPTRYEQFDAADRKLQEAHLAARVREAKAEKEAKAAAKVAAELKARLDDAKTLIKSHPDEFSSALPKA